jgi:hypothetical protein
MRNSHPSPLRSTIAALTLFLLTPLAFASSHNPADYPLRVHIYRLNRHTHYYGGVTEWVEGDGRANLFENGIAHGIDFAYNCSDRFMNSSGYETYFARWKKPGLSLVLLMREIGSANSTDTCELKVDVKDFAYVSHQGVLDTEPVSVFQAWMVKHEYDPEHGKNEPIRTPGPLPAAAPQPIPTPGAPSSDPE